MAESDNLQMQDLVSRQKRILELLQRDGHVRVPDLSRLLDVSEITIRRDLTYLENKNLLERTHGGAISSRRITKEINYSNRSDLELENKDQIGKKAAELIEDGDTVFINGGSTTFHVFRYITSNNVKIVTTNAGAIGQVRNENVDLIIAGGLYKPQYNTFHGSFTNEIINQVNASKAILGVHGISFRHGLTTPRQDAAETTKLMINRTIGEIIVVADHRKIGLVSDFVTSPVNRITTLITDHFLDEGYKRDFEELGIKVIQTRIEN
ncbi:DeoR/GlpR family DNA-binding transcription regulator [Spirochaeta isovalerica]|uniref:DeoR family fructose operon transcriptional repressor n=1 Tax=Spirochaeta isovalerica TaxID=150 RepID=A0A841RA35_9SPIO|nr:DeoR/GlpR family DNA-binding transcription regulator [Spirochaeta isovalerica]MBB6479789.1 DeoR family fructose operon transcriptional repressor [Spirochaeta isovalerica]